MMTEDELRAAVVAEAMTWLGTPFHHNARLKGVGVDCAMFVIAVYSAAGLIAAYEPAAYPHDWHIHRDVERYLAEVLKVGREITREQAKPGDIVLYKFGRVFAHGAIVVAWPQIIHALISARCVTLGDADRDADLVDRHARFFSYWTPSDGG